MKRSCSSVSVRFAVASAMVGALVGIGISSSAQGEEVSGVLEMLPYMVLGVAACFGMLGFKGCACSVSKGSRSGDERD